MMGANTTMEPDTGPFITGVILGGFQVFAEPTLVPLCKLTFLFGPNSAGKSAVEDALILLGSLLDSSGNGMLNFQQMARHWRKSDEWGNYAPLMTLGLVANIPASLPRALRYYEGDYPDGWGHEMSATFRYKFNEDDFNEGWRGNDDYHDGYYRGEYEFRLGVDGVECLALDTGKRLGVRLSHPLMDGVNLVNDFDAIASALPEYFSVGDGWVWFNSLGAWFRIGVTDRHGLVQSAGRDSESPAFPTPEVAVMLKPALDELVDLYDEIKRTAFATMSASPQIVSGSRTVPTTKELTHLCNLSHLNSGIEAFGMLPNAGLTYRDLAESCLIERFGSWYKGRLGSLVAGVNRALSDHLFLERGYQLAAEFRVIVGIDWFTDQRLPTPDEIKNCPVLVQVYLVDSQGRRHSFEQVGSGLGYILPVLCSISNPRVSVSLLQQPELHLHPALQAALGDVFIEAASPEHQIVVETHSEHLLLRILKRIRQTSSANPPVPELRLKPEDVVVAYFDPKPDGTTTVRQLRISDDGEFLDRWPRGFFTERDQELFDE